MTAQLLRIGLFLLMLLSGCTKETVIVTSGDVLVDPAIAPRILYSYPPLNSVGPYAEWSTSSSSFPTIEMRFNKLMDPASVRGSLMLTSNLRTLVVDSSSVSNTNREVFRFRPHTPSYGPGSFLLGEVLTLGFARHVADVNGNLIPAGPLGTFQPEPIFRMRQMSPPPGTDLYPANQYTLTLRFNSPIDSTIYPFLAISPTPPGRWTISGDSMSVTRPLSVSSPVQQFDVGVASGAPDREGHRTLQPFSGSLKALPFIAELSSYWDTLNTPLFRGLSVYFSYPVDATTLSAAIHVTPAVPGGLDLSATTGSRYISVMPHSEYAPDTRYVVRIDTTIRSVGGFNLSEEFTFGFKTAMFTVTSNYPRDLDYGISTYSTIYVTSSGLLDSSTIRSAFTITPPTAGVFQIDLRSNYFYFRPSTQWLANTTYAVTVGTSLRSVSGYQPLEPYTFSFTTGN